MQKGCYESFVVQCKVCGASSDFVFRGTILRKYDVAYYRCPTCDFMQTEEPYWLAEAYSSAISYLDLGPVNRAITGASAHMRGTVTT